MKIFKANIYQLTDDRKWRFGGEILDVKNATIVAQYDSAEKFETREHTQKTLNNYCKINVTNLK